LGGKGNKELPKVPKGRVGKRDKRGRDIARKMGKTGWARQPMRDIRVHASMQSKWTVGVLGDVDRREINKKTIGDKERGLRGGTYSPEEPR